MCWGILEVRSEECMWLEGDVVMWEVPEGKLKQSPFAGYGRGRRFVTYYILGLMVLWYFGWMLMQD